MYSRDRETKRRQIAAINGAWVRRVIANIRAGAEPSRDMVADALAFINGEPTQNDLAPLPIRVSADDKALLYSMLSR